MRRLLGVAVLLSTALLAQAPAAVCNVGLRAIVVDRHQQPVSSLEPASFEATDPKGAAAVAIAQSPPRRAVLLIDISGSAGDRKIWTATSALAEAVIRGLPAQVEVRLASFGSQFRWDTPWTQPAGVLAAPLAVALQNARRTGGTAMFDAFLQALQEPSLQTGDVLVTISDGEDDASLTTTAKATQALARRGIGLVILKVGADPFEPWIKGFLEHAGGLALVAHSHPPTPVEATFIARQAWQVLAAQVIVTVAVPPGDHEVKLKLRPDLRQAGDRLVYAPQPVACPKP